jgi:hypothetical protein
VPSQYNQSQLNPFYARNKYVGLFAQDSWHLRENLTLNYGLRWDRIAPWSEKYNQISTFVPGAQSESSPARRRAFSIPAIPAFPTRSPPSANSISPPRVGLPGLRRPPMAAWVEKILGAPGTTSIRTSFGNFYTAIDALSISVLAANAPYGTTYTSPAPPLFATPFISAADGTELTASPSPTPLRRSIRRAAIPTPASTGAALSPSAAFPATTSTTAPLHRRVDALHRAPGRAQHRPQRKLCRHLESSPARSGRVQSRQSGALPQPQPAQRSHAGNAHLRRGRRGHVYYPVGGGQVNGTRGPLGSNFGSNALQSNIGHANYNALELSARHTSGRLEFSAAYTYQANRWISPRTSAKRSILSTRAQLCAVVVRREAELRPQLRVPASPRSFDRWSASQPLTNGWSLSGITRFASGFPVTMINNGDNSLIGTNPNGVNNSSIDEPDYNGGAAAPESQSPHRREQLLRCDGLQHERARHPGTAKRRFFYGPGADNYDMALAKKSALTESKSLLFRVEAFNLFNHAQFNGPGAVDGNIGSFDIRQCHQRSRPTPRACRFCRER